MILLEHNFSKMILKKVLKCVLTVLFIVLVLTNPLYSLDTVVLDNKVSTSYTIGKHLEYLEDASRELTIEDVTSDKYDEKFKKTNADIPNFGASTSNFWFRFSLKNKSQNSPWLLEFDNVFVGKMELYSSDENGLMSNEPVWVSGLYFPYTQREFKSRTYIHVLKLKQSEAKTYYLKVIDINGVEIPIKIKSTETHYRKEVISNLLLGLFLGIVFIMTIYNLFIFFTIKDMSYLFYILFILAFASYTAYQFGIVQQYIIPNGLKPAYLSLHIFIGITSLTHIFMILFIKKFLNTKKNIPVGDLILTIYLIINILFVIPSFIPNVKLFLILYPIQSMVTNTLLQFTIAIAFILLKRGVKTARYFLIAFLLFFIFAIIYILVKLNIFSNNPFINISLQIGFVLQITLLSLALGDKINLMRKEKEIAQAKAIENQKLAVENLKKADELKDEFLARTSHELRTPLNGIIGLTDSILDPIHGHKLSATAKTNLAFILATTKRLYYLISDITDYSRLKYSTKIKLYRKAINLRSITTLVVAICKPLVLTKSIELINDVDDELPPVSADEDRLQQILYNLVGNAIKYTDEGYIKVSARELDDEYDAYIEVRVTDTGIGIDRDKQNKIFNSYEHYDKDNRNTQGLGLGLNITKLLVETNGGKIYVEYGEKGKGTSFVFTLPKADEIDEPLNELKTKRQTDFYETISQNVINTNSRKKENAKGKILVADDDGTNVQFLVDLLDTKGYDVEAAFDGEEALNKINNDGDIDLILLDLLMPKMSGYELCGKIRESHSIIELPIIIFTAKEQTSSVTTCFERGANDYLMKPCNKDELLARIETLLKLKESTDRLNKLNEELEQKVMERTKELEERLIELKNANNELSVFSYIVAHDLQSPINVIDSHIQHLLMSNDTFDDESNKHLKDIYETEKEMIDIINALLKLSTVRSKNLEHKRIDLSQLVIESLSRQKKMDKETKVKIDIDNNVVVYGDEDLLRSMIDNLISNAWKFTKKVDNPQITFGKSINDGREVYFIKDNGIGFEMKHKDDVFEVFKRLNDNNNENNYKGFGIGLAIVKRVIDKHQGKIWVESEPNKGTTFYFSFK